MSELSSEVRRRIPPAADEPKSDGEKIGVSFGSHQGSPLVSIEVPNGVWALLSLTFACSVTLLYVNVDMRSINIEEFKQIKNITVNNQASCLPKPNSDEPVLWLRGKSMESGYLRHVFDVFRRSGYRVETTKPPHWDVLWSHEYPFGELSTDLSNLTPGQKVNHVPGTGFITNKVSLATGSFTKHIPRAFRLPKQKQEFLNYARANPRTLWVQKSNDHRGIVAKQAAEVEVHLEDTFVQQFIEDPLLVDGHKFDIGVYVVMTSIKPLRVYIYEGDALLRFCSKPYDKSSKDLDSYVVGDNYLPTWDVPSLKEFYNRHKLSMKQSLNLHLRQKGLNPDKIWKQINEAVSSVYFEKIRDIEKVSRKYFSTDPFFEMVRFDFLVDSQLNAHLLEANMSPNLSSAHFKQNARLYEQVIYNLLSVLGLQEEKSSSGHPSQMLVSDADLAVYPGQCSVECAKDCRASDLCTVCAACWNPTTRQVLASTFVEHQNRKKYRRLIPVPERDPADTEFMRNPLNKLLYLWFEGKCQMDDSFCS
ncbi:tubulin polyglutamylase TTLL4 [Galendromus occidentalis]|uniref:Tubulin polyglutamylase TTLL4 n=1 Tax=Galendromus occidentalis TaxID=34638 RepID=A0AAJ6VWK8_9ACAR|nr:tubulin polyglutamylase TTLL4 [Galendromus occidentalis]